MNETQLLSAENEEIADSTSFSGIAFVGFLLSLVGVFCIQYVQVMPVAILSAALGFFSLIIAARSNLSIISKILGALALIIGTTTASWGISSKMLGVEHDLAQAKKVSFEYLNSLSKGDLTKVYYLVGFQLDATDVTATYGDVESKSQRAKKKLYYDPTHVEIRERRAPAKWVFVGLEGEFAGSTGYTYKLEFRDEGQTNPPSYWIYAKKDCEKNCKNETVHWFVDNLEAAKKL
jgi:hypothetical protein